MSKAKKQPTAKLTKGKKISKTAQAQKKPSPTGSKQSALITLLQRPAGATIEEMAKTTGWQKHSVLGAISGVLKKRLGLTITSDKEERGRVYRVASPR